MKVMLIVPPNSFNAGEKYFVTFPLGLAYIAAVLERGGHEVSILDALVENPSLVHNPDGLYTVGLRWCEILDRIKKASPGAVGITSSYAVQFPNVGEVARLVKEWNVNIPVIVGGAHPSSVPDAVLSDRNIDFVVVGEAEETICELISVLEKKRSVRSVKGIAYRNARGEVIRNAPRSFIQNLDSIPFPARHLFHMGKYFKFNKEHALFSKRKPSTTMITSRGCPEKCSFCSVYKVWGRSWRPRSAKNVVDEIQTLVENYGIKEIHFEDDNLTLWKERIIKICDEIIARGLDITWTTPNGIAVNTLDRDVIKKMRKSGCYRIFLGIESGCQEVLDNVIGKNISLERTKEVIGLLNDKGIAVTGFFVLGMPGETIEQMEETIRFACSFDFDRVLFGIATPYPGTLLYEQCVEKGYIESKDLSKFNPKYALISTPDFSSSDVERIRNRGYAMFQLAKAKWHPIKYFLDAENYKTLLRYSKFAFNNYILRRGEQ